MPVLPAGVAGLAGEGANIAALAGGAPAAALKLFTDGLESATADMAKFVDALSPGTVMVFDKAMLDLFATIGQALEPALVVFTELIERVADVISPLMQALAPILKDLADIVGTVLLGALDAVIGVIAIFSAIFGGAGDALKSFKTVIMDLVRWMVSGIGYLVKLFAGAQAVSRLAEQIGAVGARAVAAPKDVAVKGIADIASSMTQAAFAARGGGEGDDEMLSLQRSISEDLRKIASNKEDFQSWLIDTFLVKLAEKTLKVIIGEKAEEYGTAARLGIGILSDNTLFNAVKLRLGL